MINTMENTINDLSVTKSLKLLRDGFKNELATFIFADERTTQLFAELISEFVEANIPVVDDEKKFWGRKPAKPRKMGDPLPPPKGKLPKKNSDKKVLEGYYLLKRLGKPIDAIEPLILHLL